MTFILLILALIFNLVAQYFLKQSVINIHFENINFGFISRVISIPQIWIGAFSYGFSFLFYIMAMSRGELSRISPVSQALTTIGVVLISVMFFNEPLTMTKIVGLVLLIAGTIILFQ